MGGAATLRLLPLLRRACPPHACFSNNGLQAEGAAVAVASRSVAGKRHCAHSSSRSAVQNVPPNILANAGTWATHMAFSSNTRYQMINGLDMVGAGRVGH